MIGGERGLISYYEKEKKQKKLIEKKNMLSKKLNEFEKKNKLLSTDLNLDYVETLYREKLKLRYGVETFPIIIFEENGCKTLVGGYDELTSFIANRKEYIDNSTPIKDNKKEPT